MRCNHSHPIIDEVNCNKDSGNHEEHSGFQSLTGQYIDWENTSYVPPKRKPERKGRVGKNDKSKGLLKQMANRIEEKPKTLRHYIPTESDARGRVALYLLKYLGEWVSLDELAIKEVGGSAAEAKVKELINYGWPIYRHLSSFRLTEDPRKPLWQANPSTITVL